MDKRNKTEVSDDKYQSVFALIWGGTRVEKKNLIEKGRRNALRIGDNQDAVWNLHIHVYRCRPHKHSLIF